MEHEEKKRRRSGGLATNLLLFSSSCSILLSCGGGQVGLPRLSTDWVDDGGASIDRVWQRIAAAPVPPSADVVVGVAGHDDKMIGLPLGGGAKWTVSHPLDVRPIVAGGLVVASGAGEVFAVDARSGNMLWHAPSAGLALLGAGDDGSATVVSLRTTDGSRHRLLAFGHDGQPLLSIDTEQVLGTPAVLAHLAFVPWAAQYVSVIDLNGGAEIARVTLHEQTTRAWTQGGALWFGQRNFVRFDAHIRDASHGGATTVKVQVADLPGDPKLMPAGDAHVVAAANATDEVRAFARPHATSLGADLEDGRVYATYFRLAFGTGGGGKDGVAWVHIHPSSFLGGAAEAGGVVLCDEKGTVLELAAATGGTLAEQSVGEPLRACVVNVDEHHASGAPGEAKPLAQQISDAVLTDDPQLAQAQTMLLRQLAGMPDDVATKTLVDVASDPRTSPAVLPQARDALAKRRTGASFIEAALARHYDFLNGSTRPPAVGPMARALAGMNDGAAAPLLADHLLDPADTAEDVREAAEALAIVAKPAQLPALRRFFGMYRASAPDDDVQAAVVSVARAMLAVGGSEGRAVVQAAARDANTAPGVKEQLETLLQPPAGAGDAGADGSPHAASRPNGG
jgi:outer membrane protein assembly factor BamB